jgi:peptide/nickel transport system permease protein
MSGRYLARKLVQAAITIALIVAVNFFLFRAMPGGPERAIGHNPNVSAASIAALRERWGLDKPLFPDQFVDYVVASLHGDFGYSIKYQGQPVSDVIAQQIWPTVLLVGLGTILSVILGLALGAAAGWRRGRWPDYAGTALSQALYAMPSFWLGMILLVVFATGLGWFPSFGMSTAGAVYSSWIDNVIDVGSHLALPLATFTLGYMGEYSLIMRSSLIETLGEDYITTARAKGLEGSRILREHALPNAMLPTVTIIALNVGYIVAGALTIEYVFSWPGLGTMTVDALGARDYPILQALFLLLSVCVVLANLLADIIYGFLDPRVKV